MQANNHQKSIMNKIKLAALQFQLAKTDNLELILSHLKNIPKIMDDLDLIILSELAPDTSAA